MPEFSQRSLQKLMTCDQRLQRVLFEAIKITDFTVLEGHRGKEDQDRAVAEGKSQKPWPTGNHNKYPSTAVDIAPWYKDTKSVDWNDLIAFGRLMGIVQACAYQLGIKLRFGLDWDGDWHSVNRDNNEHFLDAPHIEVLD